MTWSWLRLRHPARLPLAASLPNRVGVGGGGGGTMNAPMLRDDRIISRAWPQGHWNLPTLREAVSALARSFWLVTALLPAAVLLAPSLAAAHPAGGDLHVHFIISLNPSTITEGETTTVSYMVGETDFSAPAVYSGAGPHSEYATAYIDITKTAASPTGGGAVNFSTNTRFSWQSYVTARSQNNLGGGEWEGTAVGTVTISTVDDSAQTGDRTVSVSGTAPYGPGMWFYSLGDVGPVFQAATLTIRDNDVPPISLALGTTTIAESGPGNSTTVRATLTSAATATVLVAVSPATSTDFTWTGGTTLTIASGATTSTNMLTITATDDATGGDKSVTLTASTTSTSYRGSTATLTITDDDTVIVLSESDLTVTEGTSPTATYTVKLGLLPTGNVKVRVARGAANYLVNKAGGSNAVFQDLTFTTTTWNTGQAITVIVLDDPDAIGSTSNISHETIDADTADEYDSVSKTLPVTDADDDAAIVVSRGTGPLALMEPNAATYTVTLKGRPAGNVVVGVTSDDAGAVTAGPASLTFSMTNWNTGQAVTVTAADDADGSHETVTVTHAVNDASSSDEFDPAPDVTFTVNVTDDDIGLVVGTVTGTATEAGGTAAFPVTLRSQPTGAVMVAVASRDTTEGTAAPTALAFSTSTWNTAQTVTVTGTDDAADDGDAAWNVRLTTTSSDTDYDALTEDVAVTTTDDDGPPGVTLALSPTSLTESGAGSTATVTATLSHPSGAATTVTVTAGPTAYTVGSDATIVIAAGATAAPTDDATIIAVDNRTDEPNRTATVTGTVTNARATADSTMLAVTGATLTLIDDDEAPTVSLSLAPQSVSENGGMATVAAVLSHPSSEPSTVTVTPVTGAYTVGTPAAIVIPAGQELVSAGAVAVLVTAVDNTIHEGSAGRTTTVTATVTHFQGTGAVTGAALTLTDDETRPTAALVLTPAAIAENGGVATVTATLSGRSTQAVTLTVATTAGTGAMAADFAQSGTTLMIAAGTTASTGAVTVTANDNNVATGSKQVTVSGTATGGHGITAATGATLTLTDDDTPQATLVLTPTSIAENSRVATVTATLDRQSSSPVTVTVSATAGTGAVAGDFTLSTTPRLLFAATATTSTGLVTITAVPNETDAPNKSVIVSGVAADGAGTGGADLTNDPPAVPLTLTDDDPAPNAALTVSPTSIHEIFASGTTRTAVVQATLDRPSSEPTTVTVTPVAGAYTVRPGPDGFIVIAAGTTATAGAPGVATIDAVDDAIHQGTAHRTTTVTATLTNPHGAGTVATGPTLTLTDNEPLPTVTLAVTPTAVTEAGGVARVTATLSGPSSQPTTLTVAAAAGTGAVAGDFTLSPATNTVLTIAAGTTTSTGTVTVTAVDNAVDLPDKQVTVTAMATGGHGVAAPSAAALTLTDDDVAGLTVDPVPSTTRRVRTSEDGDTATVRVRLATAPTATVVLDLASSAPTEGTVAPATLTFTAMTWNTAQPVTLTGVDDAPANPADGNQDYEITLTANASSTTDDTYDSVMATVYATNRDNEFGLDAGDVTGPATEAGGTATFPVALLTNPGAAVTVAVASQDPSEGTVTPSVLVFTPDPSGTWPTPQTVTVTGVDDAVDDGDVRWTVRLTTTSSAGTNYDGLDEDVAVTTRDNDDAPTVTLVLTPPAITEAGGVSTVTATLAYASSEATAVTVTATPVAPAVTGNYMLTTTTVLTIAAGALTSEGTVTITAKDNDVDAPNKTVTVTGMAANDRASRDGMQVAVTAATLTLTDDDERGFAFNPAALVVAAGGTAAYTVALTSKPTGTVTVTLTPDAAVTVEPESLTFTAMTWTTAQPVTLTVAAGTTAPASLVEHRVTGGAYETEMKALPVTRMAVPRIEPTDPIETTDEAGVHHSLRDNQLVTVTQAAGVPAGVRFTPAVPLTRPLTVAVRPLSEAAAAAAAGSGFRLGLPTERVALDVTVTPSRRGNLCLPVPAALRERAADRDLVLLRNGEPVAGWQPVRAADGRVLWVCAHVESFAPYAVGYAAHQRVAFPESDQDQTFIFHTGREHSATLPAALGGEAPLTYTLTAEPALPPGLNHEQQNSEDPGMITGRPTTPMRQAYTLTVTDVYGVKATPPLAFTIDVKPGIERRDLELVLAGIGRTLASDAVEILGSRAGPPSAGLHVTLGGQVLRLTAPAQAAPAAAPAPAAGTPSPLTSAPSPLAGEGRGEGAAAPAAPSGPSPWQRVTGVALGVARALGVTLDTPALPATGGAQSEDSTFPSAQTILARAPADPRRPASPTWRSPLSLQPVSAKDLLARSAFELPLTRTDADGLPTWTVWGRGAASGFAGQPEEGFKMDGTLYSGYLGLDYRQASLLMGLAVAHSTGTVDYERTGGTTAGVDVQLTSLLPYAHWQPYAGLGVWGLLGAGWGEMDLKAVGDPTTYTTALTSWLGAVGGRQALTTWQGIDLAAKTDAFLTTLRSEAKTNLPGARGHAERVRLLLEGQTAVALSPVSQLRPRVEVGGRWDSGTAEKGLGLELGGGLAYTQTEWGLSVDMQGRYLLVHEDRAFEDWGASVNVRLDPGLGGEGAYLTVAPVWGQPGSGVEQLWGQAAAVPGGPPAARAAGWRPGNVEIDVGYGLALADGRGFLTPYGGLVLGDPGTARYRLGSRWALSSLLDLNIEGERAEQPGQAAAHGVSVRLGWQW